MPPDESTSFAECGVVFCTFVFFDWLLKIEWINFTSADTVFVHFHDYVEDPAPVGSILFGGTAEKEFFFWGDQVELE